MTQFNVQLTIMRIVCNFLATIEPATNGNFTIVEMKYTGSVCGDVIHTTLLLDETLYAEAERQIRNQIEQEQR